MVRGDGQVLAGLNCRCLVGTATHYILINVAAPDQVENPLPTLSSCKAKLCITLYTFLTSGYRDFLFSRIICFSRECEEFRYPVFGRLRITLYTFDLLVFVYVRMSYGCAPRVLLSSAKLRVGVGVTEQPQRMLQQHSKASC